DLREALERQVNASVRLGARVIVGGKRRAGKGYYYEPTILADVTDDMPVFSEETFGPVAAIRTVRDADEAIRVANDTRYGLCAWPRAATQRRPRRSSTRAARSGSPPSRRGPEAEATSSGCSRTAPAATPRS